MPDDDKVVVQDSSTESILDDGTKDSSLTMAADDGSMEMNGEIWMTTNDHSMVGSRVPFTKREKEFLCCLIQKHVYAKLASVCGTADLPFGQGSSTSFCRVPNAAWKAIMDEYNAKDSVRRRSIKQLRKCWENLKHRGKIDPGALYSGKRLHGRTSISGAFTLTTEEDETELKLSPPRSLQDAECSEVPMLEEDGVSMANGGSPKSGRNVFTSMAPAGLQPTESSFVKFDEPQQAAENMVKHDVTKNNFRDEIMKSSPFVTSPHLMSSSSRPTMVSPRITSVRTVRSLKPAAERFNRRFPPAGGSFSRVNGSRPYPMLAKTHTQKMQEMKVKLMAARIKEHEANVGKINLQMRQAQAHHDVTMRLLRTKAAWYDAHLRQLEKQLQSGDLSLVGEEDDDYRGDAFNDEDALRYEETYE